MTDRQTEALITALKDIKSELSSIGWMLFFLLMAYVFRDVKP